VTVPAADLTPEGFRARVAARLPAALPEAAFDRHIWPHASDFQLEGGQPNYELLAIARPAAVLAPIVMRDSGLTVLLTQRASQMRAHSGQVAFPGGKVDPGETAGQTALREAHEEIGLEPEFIEPLGWLDAYMTGTGFRIAPLVALVRPGFTVTISEQEVADVFETPLAFLMNPANHLLDEREWKGQRRRFYAMPHDGRYIWGATAGILRNLYERLYA